MLVANFCDIVACRLIVNTKILHSSSPRILVRILYRRQPQRLQTFSRARCRRHLQL